MEGLVQVSGWLVLVALKLNDHINTAGVTPEQPVHQGDDLCPARDGTRGDRPGVPAGLCPFPLQGVKPQGTEPGLKPEEH